MSSVLIAVIAALGSSGVAAALVSWWKDRDKDDAEVTDMIRRMSKEAVADAKDELAGVKSTNREIRAELAEVCDVLSQLVHLLEDDIIPVLREDYPSEVGRLRSVTSQARRIV